MGGDTDDERYDRDKSDPVSEWYLKQLESILPFSSEGTTVRHPKVAATSKRAVELWKRGGKLLIFCHYIATGRALRRRVSEAIKEEIRSMASKSIELSEDEDIFDYLDRIGNRFFITDSPLRRATNTMIKNILSEYTPLRLYEDKLIDLVRRYIRTPTFIVRFFPLEEEKLNEEAHRSQV